MAIGVDEVGRGCWAGPLLVVAARPVGILPPGLKDSKLLSKNQRSKILNKLSICCQFGEGWVSPAEIDQLGLAEAMRVGVARALRAINSAEDEEIIIDGQVNYISAAFTNTTALIDADDTMPIVSAASIYAKVKRDEYMTKLANQHPDYYFDSHVGYGTKKHTQALRTHGVIKSVHRLSFKPVADML